LPPLHDLPPSQRCITIEPTEYAHTAYYVMTIIVNQGTKKTKKKHEKTEKVCTKNVKINVYESIAPYEDLNK